ncbi:site-2 protease family protein [Cohnella xylanilytica]|uniref:site-2 protease family protein n=1 Tax=Cohnella xylanilytica TaxID=557555 RepID=UPI0021A98167|nr:site-2 protease family protein [Cohnella xylanilytica]
MQPESGSPYGAGANGENDGNRVRQERQEKQEIQENHGNQENRESQEYREDYEKREHQENQENQENYENHESRENDENAGNRENREYDENRASRSHGGNPSLYGYAGNDANARNDSKENDGPSANKRGKGSWAWAAGLVVLLSKGKGILLALLKFGKPLLSMLVTVGAYALVYPWTFALGFVALIFVHEMGHVWVAKRKGLPVSAPVFIPFLGAMILLKRQPKDAVTEAAIAIGGPLLGSAGALLCYGIWYWSGSEVWLALSYVGFFLNLINLLPIHPLDGGRIAVAVSRWLWVVGAVAGPFVIWYTHSILFLLLWIWFLWQMYRRFFGKSKGGGRAHYAEGMYRADVDPALPDWYLSGQLHKRELPFTAYCRMDGQHVVEFSWDTLSFKGELEIDQPCTIRSVSIVQVAGPDAERRVTLRVRAEGEVHEPSNYYEVPLAARWRFGLLYGGLAAGLAFMMWLVHESGLTRP